MARTQTFANGATNLSVRTMLNCALIYSASNSYNTGDITYDSSGFPYYSLVDSNSGNTPASSPTKWTPVIVGNHNYNVYASGTAANLANTTSAALSFGTTSPTVTIANAGTYEISSIVHIKYAAATITNQTLTMKLRRTNNTATDLTNSSTAAYLLPIATAATVEVGYIPLPTVIYTATAGDIVSMFGVLSAAEGAGHVTAVEASIVAIRLY